MSDISKYKNEDLKPYITNYLQEQSWYNPSRRTNNQFFCINPNHNDSEGSNPNMEYNKKNFTCHCHNCTITYDIFDIVALNEIIPAAEKESMKNNNDEENKKILNKYFKQSKERIIQKYIDSGIQITPIQEDLKKSDDSVKKQASLYNQAMNQNLYAYEYMQKRGIPDFITKAFKIYQIEDSIYFKKNPEDIQEEWKIIPCKKLLFKYNEEHYSQRILLPEADLKALNKKRYYHAGERTIFLEGIFKSVNFEKCPLFITEGEIDSLSYYAIQGEKWSFVACGLGSASEWNLIIKQVEELKTKGNKPEAFKFILALDSDNAGTRNQETLKKKLEEQGIKTIDFILPEGIKDSNEYLMKDKESFKNQCLYYIDHFEDIYNNQREVKKDMKDNQLNKEGTKENEAKMTPEEYSFNESGFEMIERFEKAIQTPKDKTKRKTFKTGFSSLDEALNRGIREGLIVIGARSGTGKTAFVSQMVEQLAMTRDYDILFYSLEMSKKELISRSLSRLSVIMTTKGKKLDMLNYLKIFDEGTTTADFLEIDYFQAPSGTEQRRIQEESIKAFKSYSKHIFIKEGNGTINAEDIEKGINLHKAMTGKNPLVVIDYLQLLSKIDSRDSDIEKLDKNIMRLKQISRDNHIPIILISSFNRGSYDSEAKEESFKGSGGIEYSSDILMTIDFDFTSKPEDRQKFVKEQKAKNDRNLVIDILKNRQNKLPSEAIKLHFNSKFMIFYTELKDFDSFRNYLEESELRFIKEKEKK